MPTTTAPASAAAPSQNRYSGSLPRSTPTCGGSTSPIDSSNAARAALAATDSDQVHTRSSTTTAGWSSVGPGQEEIGDGRRPLGVSVEDHRPTST